MNELFKNMAKAMENFNIPLVHCDYIAHLISNTLLDTDTENSQMLKDVSSVKLDLADEGYLLSTKKTIIVKGMNGIEYKITVEQL